MSTWQVTQSDIAKGLEWSEESVTSQWNLEEVSWESLTYGAVPGKATLSTFSGIFPAERVGEQFIVPVMMDRTHISSPFEAENRHHFIEFGYPQQYDYKINVQIPKGLILEEIPERVSTTLPNRRASFFFMVQQEEDQLSIQSSFRLQTAYYAPGEYQALKNLFDQMADAYSQSLVLVKQEE
ncbi:MAG: hypothetical protein AAFQ98_00620 [Bacteroidota bacterium]